MWLIADLTPGINYRLYAWIGMILVVFLIFAAAAVASYVESRHKEPAET